MKVNYKSHPILEKLEKCSLGAIAIYEEDKLTFTDPMQMSIFRDSWKLFNNGFKKEINILRIPFLHAADKAKDKLFDLFANIVNDDLSDFGVQGTYLIGEFVYMINYEVTKASPYQEKAFYIFTKEGIPLVMSVTSEKHKIPVLLWVSKATSKVDFIDEDDLNEWINSKFHQILIYAMFKKYAEVETKILKPKQKVMGSIVCKYKNDTNLNLTFLDSKWFTNLVKSDAFSVRGHFRLQPKKVGGEWTKSLIWISEFEKTGYTAPARILSQSN